MLFAPPVRTCPACGTTAPVKLAHTASQMAVEGFCAHCGASQGTCTPEPVIDYVPFWLRSDFPIHHRLCGCKRCKPRPQPPEAEAEPRLKARGDPGSVSRAGVILANARTPEGRDPFGRQK
jgi:hypothetical protein